VFRRLFFSRSTRSSRVFLARRVSILLLDDEPEYLTSDLWVEDVPTAIIEKVDKRLQDLKDSFPKCENGDCEKLVSIEIREKVEQFTGKKDWGKCECCTCRCMYDPDFDGLDEFCYECNKYCCSRCSEGCECPD
jgi:hypothetical protein